MGVERRTETPRNGRRTHMQEDYAAMKRTLTIISAGLLAAVIAGPAMAQMAPPVTTGYGEHHQYVAGFDNYLDRHPDVNAELSRNPRLIDDPAYLANHPELHAYLHAHPNEAMAFRSHPDRFMHREHVYNRTERHWWNHRHAVRVVN
jgi:hypothetical protein